MVRERARSTRMCDSAVAGVSAAAMGDGRLDREDAIGGDGAKLRQSLGATVTDPCSAGAEITVKLLKKVRCIIR
jgi:hypothetical protein